MKEVKNESKCKTRRQLDRESDDEEQKEDKAETDIDLIDTIIHFGEKSHFTWPQNWPGAVKALASCDLIICLGSSLKVLKEYKCLWPGRTANVGLVIVNLQWTPKDRSARLKINAKCDDVMLLVMKKLDLEVADYEMESDQLRSCYEPLSPDQLVSCQRARLFEREQEQPDDQKTAADVIHDHKDNIVSNREINQITPGWFGKGIKAKKYW